MGFTFDKESHIGLMDGVPWPSVTQILSEFKLIDYTGVPQDVLEKKRILGTRVHHATILLDKCDLDEEDTEKRFPEILPYLEAYRKFRIIEHFEPMDKCGRLVSLKWKFHGEPDEHGFRIARYGNEHYLVDYKTTWKLYASTGPQLSGYQMLIAEKLKLKIKKRFGLLLKSNGSYELHPFTDSNDEQDFKACLWLHWQKRNKYTTSKGVDNADSHNGC